MTSPATNPGAVDSGAVYRCTACGREFNAGSAYVRHGLSHLIDPAGRSPRVCFRGRMEPVGPVVVDTTRDDRAGVTLPLELVGGGEPVPVGAGDGLGQADAGGDEGAVRGHEDSIVIDRAAVTENCCADGSQRFAEVG